MVGGIKVGLFVWVFIVGGSLGLIVNAPKG